MTLMSVLSFDATDLKANQRGRLSTRQRQMLRDLADRLPDQCVERITGLATISGSTPTKGGSQVQIMVGGVDVIVWECDDLINQSFNVFEPTRLYTAYIVQVGQRKLLISVEEGPDWVGSQEG